MNYNKHYTNLISRSKNRKLDCQVESHHIVPRCMGGTDDKDNLVDLTPEEHYVAHQLLVKIYPDEPKLVYAAQMMIPNRPNNKMYGWLRRRYRKRVSENQTGSGNSQYGSMWICNVELKKNKKICKKEVIPEGWTKGRNKWKASIRFEKGLKREESHREKYRLLLEKFASGSWESIRDFSRSDDCDVSHVSLTKYWSKYFKIKFDKGKQFQSGRVGNAAHC